MRVAEKKVGRFAVEFEVANLSDIMKEREGLIASDQVRRVTIKGVVDSGATRLVLPETVVRQLGLRRGPKVKVRYADQRTAKRDTAEEVYLELLGRHGTFTALCEPSRKTALIGAIVLEDLDLLVDCVHQRLVPRDPKIIVSEIE